MEWNECADVQPWLTLLQMPPKLHHSYWLERAVKYVQPDSLCAHLLVTLIKWKGLLNSSILSSQPSNSRTVLCIRVDWPPGTSEKLGAFTQDIKQLTRYTLTICVKTLKYINMHVEVFETEKQAAGWCSDTITKSSSHCQTLHSCLPSHSCKTRRSLADAGMWERLRSGVHFDGKNARVQSPDTHLSGWTAIWALSLHKVPLNWFNNSSVVFLVSILAHLFNLTVYLPLCERYIILLLMIVFPLHDDRKLFIKKWGWGWGVRQSQIIQEIIQISTSQIYLS